jgi:hypothetical protein
VIHPLDEADTRPGFPPAVPTKRARRRWGWALLLVASWLFQTGLRLWLARGQTLPLAAPDEPAYLIAARVMAGGVPDNFSYSTLYPSGYPLLLTPLFWFSHFAHNPIAAYRAVLDINAPIGALLLPLAYVAGRRLQLGRSLAYGVAFVTALLPAGLFYTEYAMTDAIYPVLVLAWLLATHSWLTGRTARSCYLAAAGSGLLAGYLYAVHSRGLVIVAGYLVVGLLVWKRYIAPRGTLAVAAGGLVVTALPCWLLNRYLASKMYPQGARSLSGEAKLRLDHTHGVILVIEMAFGQMWRFTLDGWGVAALGFVAAVYVLLRRATAWDLRIMAGLAVSVTLVIAITAPAALPPDQSQAWAGGRYLDCMITTFFIPGCVVLLRAGFDAQACRRLLAGAALVVPLAVVTAVAVYAYAGASVSTAGFTGGFTFAEPAVLTQNWTSASVLLATVGGLALLAVWVAMTVVLPSRYTATVLAGLGLVSLVAVMQLTSHVSQASESAAAYDTTSFISSTGLKPGEGVAIGTGVNWSDWMPQAYQVWWTPLRFFDPATQAPPPGVSVVELAWPAGQPAQASWPAAPRGWHIAATDGSLGWVAWRHAA